MGKAAKWLCRRIDSDFTAALGLFCVAAVLRIIFFQGFVLCDDAQELPIVVYTLANGIDWNAYLMDRFPVWLFNYLVQKAIGTSEFSFFLPTVFLSSALSPIGFFVLRRFGYSRRRALSAGILTAAAPFEIMIGTLRANDLFLEFFLALAFLLLFACETAPVRQGLLVAAALWLGFYVKLWAVYALVPLGFYYLGQVFRHRRIKGVVSFALASGVLHAAGFAFWKVKTDVFFPFLHKLPGTYPVAPRDLIWQFGQYPRAMLYGSEFGTTLFGGIPYVMCACILVKLAGALLKSRGLFFDRLDKSLFCFYAVFFVLLNFFPNNFRFDVYYSVPRIFRYLAPISFPLALHAAKGLIDIAQWAASRPGFAPAQRWIYAAVVAAALTLSVFEAAEATGPGRMQRRGLIGAVGEITQICPPQVVVESWLKGFMQDVFVAPKCRSTIITTVDRVYTASAYEEWLAKAQNSWPPGTLLLSGIGSCVHIGCHQCGFRLNWFAKALSADWQLIYTGAVLDFLPRPEPVRLWVLLKDAAGNDPGKGGS